MTGRPSCAAAVAGPLQALLTDVLIYCLKNDFCSALPLRHLFLFRTTEAFQTVLAVPPQPRPCLNGSHVAYIIHYGQGRIYCRRAGHTFKLCKIDRSF